MDMHKLFPMDTYVTCSSTGNFAQVNYSTKSDVCGLIFAEITTSRRARHVIFVTIFRALFLAPGSFVSLTDIRFREFQLSRGIYEERGNDVVRVPRCNFLPCVSPLSIAIVGQTRGLVSSEIQVLAIEHFAPPRFTPRSTRSLLRRALFGLYLASRWNSADLHSPGGKGRHGLIRF